MAQKLRRANVNQKRLDSLIDAYAKVKAERDALWEQNERLLAAIKDKAPHSATCDVRPSKFPKEIEQVCSPTCWKREALGGE